jgi:nifR3 family TIM-barrel protein
MSFLRKPFTFGRIELPSNIFYAPLAGCTDLPFRQMAAAYRPGLFFCEMVKIEALIRRHPRTLRYLDYTPEMHPIGAQICGSRPSIAAEAAKIIEEMGFDAIDLNCGCPVDKVTKDGSGSGLLKNPQKIGEIVHAIASAVKIPVSLKIRSGWNEQEINAVAVTQIAEQAGACAIIVHGRTRAQGYRGTANRSIVRDCKAAARHILVIGNGDIFDGPGAEQMFAETNCDGILVARGTLGRPWIVEDIERHLSNRPPADRTMQEVRRSLLDHFLLIQQYQSEKQAVMDMRRVGCWYLKAFHGAKPLRLQIIQGTSSAEMLKMVDRFDWEGVRRG